MADRMKITVNGYTLERERGSEYVTITGPDIGDRYPMREVLHIPAETLALLTRPRRTEADHG
jgi:hypothetical protein